MTVSAYTFKIASEAWEFAQIHRLNYRTFAEEIPRRPANPRRSLPDAFHHENVYLICLQRNLLVGMVAVRGQRPFSLDAKLPALDSYLPAGHSLCEIRLLAVRPRFRRGRVFAGLVDEAAPYCRSQGYTLALISGTVRQAKLYRHLGFMPFGPLVGTPKALFQPMYLTAEAYQAARSR